MLAVLMFWELFKRDRLRNRNMENPGAAEEDNLSENLQKTSVSDSENADMTFNKQDGQKTQTPEIPDHTSEVPPEMTSENQDGTTKPFRLNADNHARSTDLVNMTTEDQDLTNYRKVFVGNIGYRHSWRSLKDFFRKFGDVVYAQVVFDHLRQRSRGIGFVEFATQDEAYKCLFASDEELLLDGRQLRVNFATESKKSNFTLYPKVPELTASPTKQGETTKSAILTVDVWMTIFEYLTVAEQIRLERVCRQWRETMLQVWKCRRSLKCTGFSLTCLLTDKVLTSLLNRCGRSLYTLDLGVSAQLLTEYSMTIIGHYCPHLSKLNMSGVSATNHGLRDLSKSTKNLKWINLHKCIHVAEKGLWWILKNCDSMEYVNITGHMAITGKCFYMLRPTMKHLIADNCYRLSNYSIDQLSVKCPHLQELRLSRCPYLTDSSLLAISKLRELTTLDLSSSFLDAAPGLSEELGNLHNLRELRLDANIHITDQAVLAITRGCAHLRILSLQGCRPHVTRTGLLALSKLTELIFLDISYIEEVDDYVLERFTFKHTLEQLVLRICPHVTDIGVQRVLELYTRLRVLDLSGNRSVTRSALMPVTLTCQTTDRSPNLPLQILIGGTTLTMEDEHEATQQLKTQLLPNITLQETNLSDHRYDPDSTLYMAEPWSEEEEEIEEDEQLKALKELGWEDLDKVFALRENDENDDLFKDNPQQDQMCLNDGHQTNYQGGAEKLDHSSNCKSRTFVKSSSEDLTHTSPEDLIHKCVGVRETLSDWETDETQHNVNETNIQAAAHKYTSVNTQRPNTSDTNIQAENNHFSERELEPVCESNSVFQRHKPTENYSQGENSHHSDWENEELWDDDSASQRLKPTERNMYGNDKPSSTETNKQENNNPSSQWNDDEDWGDNSEDTVQGAENWQYEGEGRRCWGDEEEWVSEATNAPLPAYSPPQGVMLFDEDAFDDDYDEFLVNDDPLEMERWDFS